MKTIEFTLPENFSTAILYGDSSGLSNYDIDTFDEWHDKKAKHYDLFYCVNVSEKPFFMCDHELKKLGPNECLIFTFQIN